MKSLGAKSLISGFVFLFILIPLAASPANSDGTGTTRDSFVLSGEEPGNLIALLQKAEYGNYTLYQVILEIQAYANPPVSGIITPAFLSALSKCPADSQVFTAKLNHFPAGSSLAISTDGTVQIVNFHLGDYYNKPGAATLISGMAGVGDVYFVHSGTRPATADFNAPLTHWETGGTTYHVFGIASSSVKIPEVTKKPFMQAPKGGSRTMGSPFSF